MSGRRLREIIGAFSSVGLTSLIEKGKAAEDKSTPHELRLAFEKLGPSFVKIGQILSTRSDIFPEAYVRELSKLQSNVLPLPTELVMEAIEAELTGPVSAYFSEIRPEPLASGSVAQTHRARLLNGKDVIIKIQRPNLPEIIEEDLTLLIRLSRRIPKAFIPMVELPEVLQQIKESLMREIDFRNEAQAMITFAELNQSSKCIASPEVHGEFTTPRLIVEDYVSGIPINHYDELIKAGYDLEDIGRKLMLSFIKQVFKDGFFHGDPHPGNLFISDDKIYFIDFGIMGKLDNGMRVALNDILYSFTAQDIEGMMKGILSITSFDTSMNKSTLAQDVERMLAKYSSLDIGVLSITDLIEDLLNVFVKNGLKASPQITILEKAALQIEGIFRELAPEVDLMTLAKNYFLENMGPDMLKQALNKETLLIELFYQLKNGKNIPRRLNQLLEQVLNGRILVNHDLYDYTNRIKFFNRVVNRFVLSLLFFAVLISAVILSFNQNLEILSNGLFVLALLLFLWDLVLKAHQLTRRLIYLADSFKNVNNCVS